MNLWRNQADHVSAVKAQSEMFSETEKSPRGPRVRLARWVQTRPPGLRTVVRYSMSRFIGHMMTLASRPRDGCRICWVGRDRSRDMVPWFRSGRFTMRAVDESGRRLSAESDGKISTMRYRRS